MSKMSVSYWGSKKKLRGAIADAICECNASYYYEPFCGMAYVGMELLRRETTLKKHFWSDLDKNIVVYWKALRRGWLPRPLVLRQSSYTSMKHSKAFSPQKSFYGYHLGWGGSFFLGKKPTADKNTPRRLQATVRRVGSDAAVLRRNKVQISCKSHTGLKPLPDSVIYCDPPYLSTKKSKCYFSEQQMAELWESMHNWLQKGCIVFLSASKMPTCPPHLKLRKVNQWRVVNNTTTIISKAPKYRTELLLSVSLRKGVK